MITTVLGPGAIEINNAAPENATNDSITDPSSQPPHTRRNHENTTEPDHDRAPPNPTRRYRSPPSPGRGDGGPGDGVGDGPGDPELGDGDGRGADGDENESAGGSTGGAPTRG
ncbi:hypothetical protein [Thermomonospora umbrina]|uniref:hypothetical protein n=1 Tax=Thermomonospora umbrina TaxID=111806 RepID=UPI001FE51345|nr:hypothetical protein [Thermomonospora umbrina]